MSPAVLGVPAPASLRRASGVFRASRRSGRAQLCVRERIREYEDEGNVRLSQGSLSVDAGAWWSVALSAPDDTGDETLFVQLDRHGAVPAGYRGDVQVHLSVPRSELDVVVRLLAGVVEQARDNGVIPPASTS